MSGSKHGTCLRRSWRQGAADLLVSRCLSSIERQHRRPDALVVEDAPPTRDVLDILNDVRMAGTSIV